MPCLINVVNEIGYPRLPTLRGKQTARTKEIPVNGKDDLVLEESQLGLNGSPTRVVKIAKPKVARNGVVVDTKKVGVSRAVKELVDFLEGKDFV